MHRSVVKLILCQLSVKFRVSPDFCVVINVVFVTLCRISFLSHSSHRSNAEAHLETQIKQHLNLGPRSLETTQRLVMDQSQQIEQLTTQVKVQDQYIKYLNCPPFVWKFSNFQMAFPNQSDCAGYVTSTNQIALSMLLAPIRLSRVCCWHQSDCAG